MQLGLKIDYLVSEARSDLNLASIALNWTGLSSPSSWLCSTK